MALVKTIVLTVVGTSSSGDGECSDESSGELDEHCMYVMCVARFGREATSTQMP